MKVVCISKFNYYDLRMKPVMDYFSSRGDEVVYLTGDYDTMTREYYQLPYENVKQLPVMPYRKNISFQRIYSHYRFAKQIYKQLQIEKPDLIYAMVPPNFMTHFIAKYKKQHPHIKVIFDIFDMWPETFPNQKAKSLLAVPFKVWESLRTKNLPLANMVVTECQSFYDHVQQKGNVSNLTTLYPYKTENTLPIDYTPSEVLNICYLGSINNIIDISKIVEVLTAVRQKKAVCLHLIGNGEKKQQLIQLLKQVDVDVVDYGNVFDTTEKQRIFNQCAFGINVLKPSVFIGLTLKTIDYFNGGLPILNTVPKDTHNWVVQHHAGIDLHERDSVDKIVSCTAEDILKMKHNAREVYRRYLSKERYDKHLCELLERVTYE